MPPSNISIRQDSRWECCGRKRSPTSSPHPLDSWLGLSPFQESTTTLCSSAEATSAPVSSPLSLRQVTRSTHHHHLLTPPPSARFESTFLHVPSCCFEPLQGQRCPQGLGRVETTLSSGKFLRCSFCCVMLFLCARARFVLRRVIR